MLVLFLQMDRGSFDDTTGTFILSHDYSENTNLYFKVADGFKAGGFNAESSKSHLQHATLMRLKQLHQLSSVLRVRYFNNRMMMNVAYFDNEHEDMQISYFTADAAAASEVINNSADISGLEIETTTLINDSTRLMVNLSTLILSLLEIKLQVMAFSLSRFLTLQRQLYMYL